jgi:hypothetical protein
VITIGDYRISELAETPESFWIEYKSGEGMQVSAAKLAKWLDKFYKENF